MSGAGVHRVHCFDCGSSYEQNGPHPQVCGTCGSRRIGVHSDPTRGELWTITITAGEGVWESHEAQASGVGEIVQSLVDEGMAIGHTITITQPAVAERSLTVNEAIAAAG